MHARPLASRCDLTLALAPDLVLMRWRDGPAARARRGARERRRISARVGHGCHRARALLTLVAVWRSGAAGLDVATAGPIAVDDFRWAADVVFLLGDRRSPSRSSIDYNDARRASRRPSRTCSCCSRPSGMMLLAAARDLMIVFLGIELMSVVGLRAGGHEPAQRARPPKARSSTSCSARSRRAFLLYGIALVYGATGSDEPAADRRAHRALRRWRRARCCWSASRCCSSASAFKVAAAPFHMWAPDVYDGAPTPITAHGGRGEGRRVRGVPARLARGLRRRLRRVASPRSGGWRSPRWSSATLIGLAQRNLKRLLAYSSIAHAGYLLVAVAAGDARRARRRCCSTSRLHARDVRRVRGHHRARRGRRRRA